MSEAMKAAQRTLRNGEPLGVDQTMDLAAEGINYEDIKIGGTEVFEDPDDEEYND